MKTQWESFKEGKWVNEINVQDFILKNFCEYEGDDSFLTGPTANTVDLWEQLSGLMKKEREMGGVLDVDTEIISDITSHKAGFIDKDKEKIVGLQTDKPLKRSLMPFGGIKIVEKSLKAYERTLSPQIKEIFTKYRKTHNDGVFSAYTEEMRACRKSGVITGLPDSYGRGRIIGDYRRPALYGLSHLIEEKSEQLKSLEVDTIDEDIIRLREEIFEQIKALKELIVLGKTYNCDMERPAKNAQEAVQWTYLSFLAAIKEQNGAAMSLGRTSSFFDIYFKRDLERGTLTEQEAQEIIDHFVMKLRAVRFLRPPEYNELFSGDPVWITECIGGMTTQGKSLVTKTSFRMLNTLFNLGPAPEPNLTVLYSERLPLNFKKFCSKVSTKTSSIQYENDDLMRPKFGDDYAIACCVSAMPIGKQMQFFGARANLAKTLLYAINGGIDEKSGVQVAPSYRPINSDVLAFDEVMEKFDVMMDWLAKVYINSLNIIHYMHDKYCYERIQMALHDRDVIRTMASGMAGLSVVADSLSAIKFATVKPIRNKDGITVDFDISGDFPKYGNNDDRVDQIAIDITKRFMDKLRKQKTYRQARPTQSILTITSNVVYGAKTGSTPDGRKLGVPFAPGANPMHGRDEKGALASMLSIAKLPYEHSEDGISYTISLLPESLGKTQEEREINLYALLDAYFKKGGHHINVNTLDKKVLLDAMENPEKYPQLTIRVSGYAVNFIKLTPEQQKDVISRTFHQNM
jgi:formate C-acetyltransferase